MKKVLFMGIPGSGKGTQSHLLEEKGFVQISIGKLIRTSADPEIVRYREINYTKGELLPDTLILKIIQNEISTMPKKAVGYILDGAARDLEQAKFLKENNLVEEVVFFDLPKGIAERRLLNRNEGRIDDNPETIQNRFNEYQKKTKPVLNYLKKNFTFHKINSEPTPEEIHEEVCKILCI